MTSPAADFDHIIIVSNRGPFAFSMEDGQPTARRGAGGLVTAISAVARQYDILWISCALSSGDRDWLAHVGPGAHTVEDMQIALIAPDPDEYQAYYNVIANPLLWYVHHQMHDTPQSPAFDQAVWEAWDSYRAINEQLAEAVAAEVARLEGRILIMPQDYHLHLFPRCLRDCLPPPEQARVTIQSFLHIPFPGADAWRVLPLALRREVIDAMLAADRIGFQTERDTRRFLQTCVDVLPGVRVVLPWRRLRYRDRLIDAAPYPISIDAAALEDRLSTPEVAAYSRQLANRYADRKLILRVDRVEPSKNILRGLHAYRNFLLAYPDWQGKVEMLALLVPSRTGVPEYRAYLHELMALAGEINATLGDGDWEPVRVLLGDNYDRAIAALSRCDVLLVNPLADGMNLVAKEGAVLNRRDGVLILSEEAGAAEEFGDAPLLVSPYDVYGTREAIHTALTLPAAERQDRARRLAEQVRANDIFQWFTRQISDAGR